MHRIQFLLKVDSLCDQFDGSVSGGRRTIARNVAVGGNPASKHIAERGVFHNGFAADIVLDDASRNDDCVDAARQQGLGATISPAGNVHVQWPMAGQKIHGGVA